MCQGVPQCALAHFFIHFFHDIFTDKSIIDMGIWRSIVSVFKRGTVAEAMNEAPAPNPRTGDYTRFFNFFGTTNSALSVATVYRCVQLLSESVANLPFLYMRLKDGIFVEDTNSRLHYLLTVQPDFTKSAFDFWKETVEHVLLEGNAYIVPVYNAATLEIDRLVLCGRNTVNHDVYNDTYMITDAINGIIGTYSEAEVIHIKGHTRDGKHGISVLEYARQTLDIALTGDRETLKRFANGGNVRGIVSNDKTTTGFGEYQDIELQKTAKDVDGRFQDGERIVSLPGQVDFKQISLSSTDMQFLESRKFTVRDICRFFGVHPSFVFDDTSNNYKSAEMANVAFLSNTLNPFLRNIENEMLRKLISPSLCGRRKFEFDRRGLYTSDLDSKIKYQSATIAAGIYTVNDWRKAENRPPIDGGDKVLVSANLRDIVDETAAKQQAEPEPKKDDTKDDEIKEDGNE